MAGTRAGSRGNSSGRRGRASVRSAGVTQPSQAPTLQLEQLLEVALPLEMGTPPGLELHPGLNLYPAPPGEGQLLKQELALPPGLLLELREVKNLPLPTGLDFHVSPQIKHNQSLPEKSQLRTHPLGLPPYRQSSRRVV